MDKIVLKLEERAERGKANRRLRLAGQVPVVIYGRGGEAVALKASDRELTKAYNQAGSSKIIGVKVGDSAAKNAIFQDVMTDPLTGKLIHADLLKVRMDEKIRTEVPLRIIGESTAVYQQEGTLVTPLESLEVEALPVDLPDHLEVDISILDDFEKMIHVSDLAIPGGVTLLTEPEELVAKVDPPRSDDEIEALEEEVVDEKPENVEDEAADSENGEKTETESKPDSN